MSKDCDVFSDSYGCIITKSIGYQSPFPVVRLSNGQTAAGREAESVQAACFTAFPADRNAARARLFNLTFALHDPCVSFLQLVDNGRPPLELDAHVKFVKKIEMAGHVSAAVTRSEDDCWSTSLYVASTDGGHPKCRRVLFDGASSASLRDGAVWLLETTRALDAALQLHFYSVEAALAGALSDSFRVSDTLDHLLDVVACTADTALVFGTGGVVVVDRRCGSAHVVTATAIANGGAAGEDKVVVFGQDNVLRVFDLRNTAVPLMEASVSSYLCVKCVPGGRAALFVTDDTVSVLDVQTLTASASLQHTGDAVLDATLLPRKGGGGVRICTSTRSGMVYDWTVAV